MAPEGKSKIKTLAPLPVLLLLAALYTFVWSNLYLNTYLNTDFGWLFTCLERYLSGGTYTQNFYETNPPLSFLIYLPAYALYAYTNVFPLLGIVITFFAATVIVGFLLWHQMGLYGFSSEMRLALLGAALFSTTWLFHEAFGQKDHLIFLFFLPYTLMQIGIIAQKKLSKPLTAFIAALGALAVCIKPHYILIPAVFIAYRIRKNTPPIQVITSADFLVFALLGLVYLTYVHIFFPDYMNLILPQAVEFYSIDNPFPPEEQLKLLFPSFLAFLIMFAVAETEQTKYLKITVYSLIGFSLLFAASYYAQYKGFFYHAAPLYGFSSMAFIMALFGFLFTRTRMADVSILIPIILLFIPTRTYMTGHPPGLLTAQEFKNLPYHKKINDYARNGIYMDLDMKSLSLGLPYYHNIKSSSRFGQIWPIFGLKHKFEQALDEDEKEDIREKLHSFIDMIAEDMEKTPPAVIIIPRYEQTGHEEPTKSYYEFLMKNVKFSDRMQHYEFAETFTFDRGVFTQGSKKEHRKELRTVDFYTLKKDEHEQK